MEKKDKALDKWHIHKVVQEHKITYAQAYVKYGPHFDEKGMIDIEILKKLN